MKVSYVVILVLVVGVVLVVSKFQGSFLSVDKAKELLKHGALLVDVRTPAEFKSGHIDNAKNIPVQELSSRLSEFGSKDKPIIVYCRSGARSGRAMKQLQAKGYKEVYNLGGIARWK